MKIYKFGFDLNVRRDRPISPGFSAQLLDQISSWIDHVGLAPESL